ncbi:hypothetical protein Dimus_014323 [Dionaea muscipula]
MKSNENDEKEWKLMKTCYFLHFHFLKFGLFPHGDILLNSLERVVPHPLVFSTYVIYPPVLTPSPIYDKLTRSKKIIFTISSFFLLPYPSHPCISFVFYPTI